MGNSCKKNTQLETQTIKSHPKFLLYILTSVLLKNFLFVCLCSNTVPYLYRVETSARWQYRVQPNWLHFRWNKFYAVCDLTTVRLASVRKSDRICRRLQNILSTERCLDVRRTDGTVQFLLLHEFDCDLRVYQLSNHKKPHEVVWRKKE